MELQAIWNRIDQLEKLVISQAKEIEIQRRQLNQIIAQQSFIKPKNNGANNNRAIQTTSICAISKEFKNPTSRQSHQPYHMNSFVHPASAIPPAISFSSTSKKSSDSSQITTTSDLLSSHQIHPANRWSMIAPSSQSFSMTGKELEQSGTDLPHRRQSFVEVLTCFCPCFSMC